MDRPMSSFSYRFMSLVLKIRDLLRPRLYLLSEVGIEPGFQVLDYGCGPGSYIAPLAELVGSSGKIYALDVHPLAIRDAKKIAARNGIENIETIQSDCHTNLSDETLDVVLLYDTFHDLSRPDDVLEELHRVLKAGGTLSISDHHMTEVDILTTVTNTDLFRLSKRGRKTYSFSKESVS
jgi:ubiquinone/menaquinone biosynthesis C-methylase UbiE